MKKINIITSTLVLGVMIAASSCTEEKIYGLDPNGIPQAGNYTIKADVDQTLNKVTLTIADANGNPAMGVYPIWKVYTKANPVMSTRPVYTDIVTIAGDYEVEMQVGNRNGISEGVQTATFHIDNTLVDFSPYILFLTNNESKVWQIAGNEQGHLGCGESGTDGLNWWSASPYDKKDWGVYDNRMTFADNGGSQGGLYTYDPGESGTIYINKEITDLEPYSSYNPNDDNDYCAPAQKQETTFSLVPEGTDLFLVFPQGTLIGYLPNMDTYNNPKFKVIDMNKNTIEIVCDNGGIAWHYLLQPEGADAGNKPFEGFKYDSEYNLWRTANVVLNSTWFADGGWGELPNQPEVTVTNESIKLHTPAEMGGDKWQGQVHIGTDIILSSASTYDFSICVKAPVDSKVTIKPHLDGDDGVFFTEDQIAFDAGGSYFYMSDVPGWDGPVVLTLDFAGYPDTDFEITKVVIKDHANDDGTILPNQDPGNSGSVSWVDVNSADNIWKSGKVTNITTYTAMGGDWSPGTDPTITETANGYDLYYPDGAGEQQWQAQFALETDLSFSGDKYYDFRITINPTCDIAGATIKPTDFTDQSFWSADRHALVAYEDNVIELVNVSAEMPDFKIVFDFAGVQPGATVSIKDILIQEHQEGGSGGANWVDVNSNDNLMTNCEYNLTYWYAPNWNQIADPDTQINGNAFTLYLPEATTDQWQAQFAIHSNITTSADKNYDFRMTIYSDKDIPGVTFKVTEDGNDDKFYMADRVAAVAYEEVTYEWVNLSGIDIDPVNIFFDFGGNPAGTTVTVKDIIIQEHR